MPQRLFTYTMIKSMTGYGRDICIINQKTYTIEIKSLNSKHLDLTLRLSGKYKEKEAEIRALANQQLGRGKVELCIYLDSGFEEKNYLINKQLVSDYYNTLKGITDEMDDRYKQSDMLGALLKLPDVLKVEVPEIEQEEWNLLHSAIIDVMGKLNDFRTKEGAALEKDITNRVTAIINFLSEIEGFEEGRMTKIKTRLQTQLDELKDNSVDQNRFEQELIYYLEKLDITEEKVRLKSHCKYFTDTLNQESSQGKKLGFIVQEMGREINTIGSKANDADIQQTVVEMKNELEKIKEQILNIL